MNDPRNDDRRQAHPAEGPVGKPSLPARTRAGARTVVLAGLGIAALGVAVADTSTFPTITNP